MNFRGGVRRLLPRFFHYSKQNATFQTRPRYVKAFSVGAHELESAEKAKVAYNNYKNGGPSPDTIFSKIINREIPAKIIYDDEKVFVVIIIIIIIIISLFLLLLLLSSLTLSLLFQCLAFHDVNPVAPSHILVIPKHPIPMLSEAEEADKNVSIIFPHPRTACGRDTVVVMLVIIYDQDMIMLLDPFEPSLRMFYDSVFYCS